MSPISFELFYRNVFIYVTIKELERYYAYVNNVTMLPCHVVTIEIALFLLWVQECTNTLLEERQFLFRQSLEYTTRTYMISWIIS